MKALVDLIKQKDTCVCVGLDPMIDSFPDEIRCSPQSVEEKLVTFSQGIVESVAPHAVAIKPQIAFFEQYGLGGLRALKEICSIIRDAGLFLVMDAKRGDIGSTAEAYARAFFSREGDFFSDALTVNGYLGSDGIFPFYEAARNTQGGVFVLVKTSNPSSSQLQDLRVEGQPVYEKMVEVLDYVEQPDEFNTLGAVAGATHPAELKKLRKRMPKRMFLIPGYGAQGGTASDLQGAFGEDGCRAIVNSSRGILYAYKKSHLPWKEASRAAALEMKEAINAVRYK